MDLKPWLENPQCFDNHRDFAIPIFSNPHGLKEDRYREAQQTPDERTLAIMEMRRFFVRMGIGAIQAGILGALFFSRLLEFFLNNPILNGAILTVLFLGILYAFQQLISLNAELKWLETLRRPSPPPLAEEYNPKILSPLALLWGKSAHFSPTSLKVVLDGIDARLQESKEIGRYLVGLLIFLGLLGTFWGLSSTIQSVASVIGGLPTGEGTPVNFLEQLKQGLHSPLEGMGIAFSSSLFGLSASLILGFFELQMNQARHHFFSVVEENLTERINLKSESPLKASGETLPAYIQALLEQTAENIDRLQSTLVRSEHDREILNTNLSSLCQKFSGLLDQREMEKNLLLKIAEGLMEFQKSLSLFSRKIAENEFGLDLTTRQHISMLNDTTRRILETTTSGQDTLSKEIKTEIRLLTKTLNNLAGDPPVGSLTA